MVVKGLCERLATKGYAVTVFTPDLRAGLPEEEWINGVHVRRYRRLCGDPLYLPSWRFFRELCSAEASVVHVHNVHTSMPLSAMVLSKGTALVLQPHYHRHGQNAIRGILLSFFKFWLRLFVLPRFQRIVANSSHEEMMLKADFPDCTERIVHIEEAIDTKELQAVNRSPEKPRRILYIGNLLRYKNVDRLLLAFSHMPKVEDLRLVIVGEGPERGNLKNQARQLNIDRLVEWKSQLSRDDLLREYSRASVFVNLSRLESFGRTFAEAVYLGLPAVVARDAAMGTVASKGNVEVVDPQNAEEVANGILRWIDCRASGRPGDQWVDWDEYVDRMLEVYDAALAATPRSLPS